jgi:hypothetical protein
MPARTGKRILFDWDTLGQYDNTVSYGVCLTQRQCMILKAALIPAYWSRRWMGFPGTEGSIDYLDAMISQIENQLDGNDCPECNMEFRDNPDDPCEVQYSNDGGLSWTTMFRKDVCAPAQVASPGDITNIYDNQTIITNNHTLWDNDIINVAPQWEYVDLNSDNALCKVIDMYIEMICDTAIAQIQKENVERRDQNSWFDDVVAVISGSIIVELSTMAAGTVFWPVAIVAAVGWATAAIADKVWDELVTVGWEQFEDEEAKQAVKCWMYQSLRGNTPQWETWTDSLSGFVPEDANETLIAEVVGIWNSDEDIYINYMLLMEDYNSIAESLPVCDCPPVMTIDLLSGQYKDDFFRARFSYMTLLAYSNPGDEQASGPTYYEYDVDRKISGISSIGGKLCNVFVVLPPNVLVTKVQVAMEYRRELEPADGDKNAGLWLGVPNAGGTYIGGYSWGSTFGVTLAHTITVEDVAGILPTPEDRLYIHNSSPGANSWCSLYWIHIEMVPYNP